MIRYLFSGTLSAVLISFSFSQVASAEKMKLGTSTDNPPQYVVALIAEDKGFWKENGLEVEVITFRGGGPLYRAVAAGTLKMATANAASLVPAVAAGVPAVVVVQVSSRLDFNLWLRGDSPMREPRDIKGSKIGVSRMGSLTHVYALVVAKALGLEKQVKVVATGGVPSSLAMLRAGAIDAMPMSPFPFLELEVKGEVRRLLNVTDYLPQPWVEAVLLAQKELIRDYSGTVRRASSSVIKAINFIRENPGTVTEWMRSHYRLSGEAARKAYYVSDYTKDGMISSEGLQVVSDFLVQYEIVPRGKVPPLKELFTMAFIK